MFFSKKSITFDRNITIPSLFFILGVCFLAAVFPQKMDSILNDIKQIIFVNFNWIYIWAVSIFTIFMFYLAASPFGKIKLGANDSNPEYSFFSWISMLFAAGMGIGLMYFSVAEPMQHFSGSNFSNLEVEARAKNAQLFTFFHWGIHAWAIYGIVGLSLAYFTYRYRLPLSLRSCFYPLLKEKINGFWGSAIDVFALCSTFFGITTTLGFGVVQINSGLDVLNIVDGTEFKYQILIVVILVSVSIISAVTGVNKGVKLLSSINIIGVLILLLFVLFLGPTIYIISSFTDGIGNYISNFFNLTFNTHVYDKDGLPWFYNWTILYWAWWISWSPYVGLFIAKISKGRTIREFVAAVLLLPTLFNFIWMSVFGNSAIWFDIHAVNGALSTLASNPDALMFRFFELMPLSSITSILVIVIIIIFFVTSADSGIFVMNSIATKNALKSPKWQVVFWGVLLAVLSLFLLNAGGLKALQSMTLITALPFSVIILMFIASLVKALVIDKKYYDRDFSASVLPWSGEIWKERLKQIVSFKDEKSVNNFIKTTVKEGFEELKSEFDKYGISCNIVKKNEPVRIELQIRHDVVNNFIYGVKTHTREISENIIKDNNLPDSSHLKIFFPESYFGDSREGYDVQFFTKNELISDVLKHYERFLKIISEETNEIFISSNFNFKTMQSTTKD